MESTKYNAGFGAPHTPAKSTSRRTLWTALGSFAFVITLWWLAYRSAAESDAASSVVKKAVAVLSGDSKVTGTITFTQVAPLAPVTISGEIKNLDANAKRGFHIHQLGDATSGCLSAGAHFNPLSTTHGAPSDGAKHRHAGDLGNVQSNASGVAAFSFTDKVISLNGPFSIVGRSVVVHAGTDDLGQGGDDESLKTGNAGGRAACGVIGLAELV